MAHLRRRAARRGQILLLGAFALAVLFVTLALVLNAVIYTENLATRADSRTSDAVAHSKSVERGTVDLLEYVNEYNTTNYSHLRNELGTGFDNFTETTSRFKLTSGVVIDGAIRKSFNGTWLNQRNSSRNFTDNDTDVTWELVDDTTEVRAFRINVTDKGELADLGPNNFSVRVSNSTHDWWLGVGKDSTAGGAPTINVTVVNGTTNQCDLGSDPGWINVSEGMVAGDDCEGLDFRDDLETIESIEFDNAQNIVGTYRLMVNQSQTDVDADVALQPSANGPIKRPAIYGAVVGIEYETTTLLYRTDRRVVPGEIDG